MSETITNIKEAFKCFEGALKTASSKLSQGNQISVERMKTLDKFTLTHGRGTWGLLDSGSDYTRKEEIKGGPVFMKRSLLIGVVSVIRFLDNPKAGIENYDEMMLPSEYAEAAIDALTGIEVESTLPEYQRKIIPVKTELVEETDGIWKYLTTFMVPMDYTEVQYR